MDKIKIVALFGKSGVGKDTIQKKIVSSSSVFNKIISCTTRPPRDNEQDKIDYYFLTNEEFTTKIFNYEMLEVASFRDWFYGTSINALNKEKINIGVFNIEGINHLLQDSRLEIIPIYISVPDKIRLIRSLNREKNPDCLEICRRFQTDDADFRNIDFSYFTIKNFNLNKATKEIKKILKQKQ